MNGFTLTIDEALVAAREDLVRYEAMPAGDGRDSLVRSAQRRISELGSDDIAQEPGFDNYRLWPYEEFQAVAADGTLVKVSRNGDGWYVGTYRREVPFGQHHRVAQMCIPDVDRAAAMDLGRSIVAGIAADATYEDKRRGYVFA